MFTYFQTSVLGTSRMRKYVFNNIFSVEVTDLDGDLHSYEVTAKSFEEASENAESLASNDGITIYSMELFSIINSSSR